VLVPASIGTEEATIGNRSRYLGLAAGTLGVAALRKRRRRAQLDRAAEGIRHSVTPSLTETEPLGPPPSSDEAHAPGHRHLPWSRVTAEQSSDVRRREHCVGRRTRVPRYPRRG